jgi:hypothetical protein
VISIDVTTTGAGTVTPPAVGLCSSSSVDRAVLMAPYAAPQSGTGLPTAGTRTAVRPRGLIAAASPTGTTTGAFLGASVRPSVQHTSSTPGDLPPEDPLS